MKNLKVAGQPAGLARGRRRAQGPPSSAGPSGWREDDRIRAKSEKIAQRRLTLPYSPRLERHDEWKV